MLISRFADLQIQKPSSRLKLDNENYPLRVGHAEKTYAKITELSKIYTAALRVYSSRAIKFLF